MYTCLSLSVPLARQLAVMTKETKRKRWKLRYLETLHQPADKVRQETCRRATNGEISPRGLCHRTTRHRRPGIPMFGRTLVATRISWRNRRSVARARRTYIHVIVQEQREDIVGGLGAICEGKDQCHPRESMRSRESRLNTATGRHCRWTIREPRRARKSKGGQGARLISLINAYC